MYERQSKDCGYHLASRPFVDLLYDASQVFELHGTHLENRIYDLGQIISHSVQGCLRITPVDSPNDSFRVYIADNPSSLKAHQHSGQCASLLLFKEYSFFHVIRNEVRIHSNHPRSLGSYALPWVYTTGPKRAGTVFAGNFPFQIELATIHQAAFYH